MKKLDKLKSLAEQQAQRTLQASEAFRKSSVNERAALNETLTAAYRQALSQQKDLDLDQALESLREDDLAAEFLNELDFPAFVASLIKGVFDAVVEASIKQMEAYAELVKAVGKSVERFAKENISDRQARDYLVSQLRCDEGTGGRKSKTKIAFSKREIRAARLALAREQRRLLREVLLMGIARLFADNRLAKSNVFLGIKAKRDASDLRLRQKLIRKLRSLPPMFAAQAASRGALTADVTTAKELSGKMWVDRFPTSRTIDSLIPEFSVNVERFLAALKDAGANTIINATRRPPERAYLMHWSWKIAKGVSTGENIPEMPGVAINWLHPTREATRAAAQEMVNGYGINKLGIAPSLTSHHIAGKAIDVNISWAGNLAIKTATGAPATVSSQPRNGANRDLIKVGASYKVLHINPPEKDVPHWSMDGH